MKPKPQVKIYDASHVTTSEKAEHGVTGSAPVNPGSSSTVSVRYFADYGWVDDFGWHQLENSEPIEKKAKPLKKKPAKAVV